MSEDKPKPFVLPKAAKSKPVASSAAKANQHTHSWDPNAANPGEIWLPNCKICMEEDAARQPLSQEELAGTVFLYADGLEESIVKEYLRGRYGFLPESCVSDLPIWNLTLMQDLSSIQIVCVRRVNRSPMERLVAENGVAIWRPVPKAELVAEVRESAPLKLHELVRGEPGNLLNPGSTDLSILTLALCQLFGGYKVQCPRPENKHDLLTVRVA